MSYNDNYTSLLPYGSNYDRKKRYSMGLWTQGTTAKKIHEGWHNKLECFITVKYFQSSLMFLSKITRYEFSENKTL